MPGQPVIGFHYLLGAFCFYLFEGSSYSKKMIFSWISLEYLAVFNLKVKNGFPQCRFTVLTPRTIFCATRYVKAHLHYISKSVVWNNWMMLFITWTKNTLPVKELKFIQLTCSCILVIQATVESPVFNNLYSTIIVLENVGVLIQVWCLCH